MNCYVAACNLDTVGGNANHSAVWFVVADDEESLSRRFQEKGINAWIFAEGEGDSVASATSALLEKVKRLGGRKQKLEPSNEETNTDNMFLVPALGAVSLELAEVLLTIQTKGIQIHEVTVRVAPDYI